MLPARQLLILVICAEAKADDTFFLPPKKAGVEVALAIIQGASSPPEGYRPIAEAIQAASPFALWVGVPEFIADTPEPVQFGAKLQSVLGQMRAAGMATNRTVLLAHSLGGVMSQSYVASEYHGIDSLVLYGATLLRSYRSKTLAVPTLTLDGDLDGLMRVTRQAEAYHHQVSKLLPSPPRDPVVLLQGLSHWSIASGTPPPNVRQHDLQPEASMDAGHTAIASVLASHLASRFGVGGVQAAGAAAVAKAVRDTGQLLAPLTAAMQLEGSKHLAPPCNSDFPTNPSCGYPKWPDKAVGPMPGPPTPLPPRDCTCGSAWMRTAATMMAGLDGAPPTVARRVSLLTADAFHDVSDVRPFHLPHIFHPPPGAACDNATTCVINMTTLTMPVYDGRDALDTGLYPTAATELRAKLKSRQAVWQKAGVATADYELLDRRNASVCAAINAAAYAWARDAASPLARSRFASAGQPLVFGDDVWKGIGLTGPEWIGAALQFTPAADKKRVTVAAPTFATANKRLGDAPFTDTVGYHYCKLLSPARAMEWLYVDGLREFGGLKAAAVEAEAGTTGVEEATADRCPDMRSLRSSSVTGGSFDAARLAGAWYENAYADPAQAGARCQLLNNSVLPAGRGLRQRFMTRYGPLPVALTFSYEPVSGSQGVYSKYAEGAKALLKLPTVIVDVGEAQLAEGSAGGDDAPYATAIEFTCKSVFGEASVSELRLLSRVPTLPDTTLAAMKARVVAAGVPQATVDKLKVGEYVAC